MIEAPAEFDFHAVLDTVEEDLLDDMDLVPVLNELITSKVFRPRILRDLQEKCNTTTEKVEALLQLVRDGGYTKYDQLKKCLIATGQGTLVNIMVAAEKGPVKKKKPMTKDEKLLAKDIIEYYLENESRMPVEQHDAELTSFYARPPLMAYKKPNAFGQVKQSTEKHDAESTIYVRTPMMAYNKCNAFGQVKQSTEQHDAELTSFYVRPPMMAYNKPNAFGQVKQSTEQHDAELTSFYVRPPMMAYNKPNAFGQVKQSTEQEKIKISSYRELLFGDNGTYKKIYLTADAGMGKTSFSKMLARTWCQAHKPDKVVADKFCKDDLDTMKNFDFLFLIKLREYQGKNMCCLDDMIVTMLQSKLPRASRYTKPFVEQVLCNRKCLIIVDGLDEWSHPEHTPSQVLPVEEIPHTTRLPGCCSVLTTTRPWKLSTARLSGKDIDRQVQITELDETTARELESRAIEILIENQRQNGQVAANSKTQTVTDFEISVSEKIFGHTLYIPSVLLQMICLRFEKNPVGKSLCEVYSNIIELTLTRWLVKTDSGHTDCKCEPSKEHGNIKLKCIENNRHCHRYMPLLLKIEELAFLTLFNDIREESLLFGKEQVLKYLSEEELEQCLKIGLLSQVKDTTSLSEVRLQLYFPHKTLHEFFCALFIATNWNNAKTGTTSIKQIISNKCTSVPDILEMSELFVFVCGLNPEVYSDITRHLATIVSTDQSITDYRNGVEKDLFLLKDYQRMQISCFLECTRNQHPECKIVIEDMLLSGETQENEQQVLVKILSNSVCSLKSLSISSYDETKDSSSAGGIVRILERTEFSCLESLNASECGPTILQNVLTSAAHTLKYLKLKWVSLTDDLPSAEGIIRIFEQTEFSCLERLNVYECGPTLLHSVLTSAPRTLKYLHLYGVSLTDDVCSAISRLNNLRRLDFSIVQVSRFSLIVPTLPLLMEFSLFLCNLRGSTIPLTLPLLTELSLFLCDLRDSTVTLSPEMTSLKTIKLRETTVNIPCCRELFLSISKLPQPITVKLKWIYMTLGEWRELLFDIVGMLPKSIHIAMLLCSGPSGEDWSNIVDDMKASPAFCVTHANWYSLVVDISFYKAVV